MEFTELLSLLGGVGLFLYGMTMMSTGLRAMAGERLRGILEKVTGRKLLSVGIGLAVTLMIQSSSATDMMVIGFVSSGLMTLSQAIGVILGANIGTTVTAQITAFNLTAYAPLLVFIGAIMAIFIKRSKDAGTFVLGFGMLFVGIGLMKQAIQPLSQEAWFLDIIAAMDNPLEAVLFGVLFTALLQSSSSSVVIFQVFAIQGVLTYNQAVYLVIGCALGAVAPNLLAGMTSNRDGKRTALLNLLFNLIRAVLLFTLVTLIPAIPRAIASLSPDNIGRQIANTHTLFAIFSVAVILPFSEQIVALTRKLIPMEEAERRVQEERKLLHLANINTKVPAFAMTQARLEVERMGKIARDNLDRALGYFFHPDKEETENEIEEAETTVDYLNQAITDALVQMRGLRLSERDAFRLSKMILVVSNFERISDHAENILEFTQRRIREKASIEPSEMSELEEMGKAVLESLDLAMVIFAKENFSLLPKAEALEQRVDDMQESYMQNHVDRMMENQTNALGGVIFTDMCTDLERCSDQALNIATALVPHGKE